MICRKVAKLTGFYIAHYGRDISMLPVPSLCTNLELMSPNPSEGWHNLY